MAAQDFINQVKYTIMAIDKTLTRKITRDFTISLLLYALPVAVLFLYYADKGETHWINNAHTPVPVNVPAALKFIEPVFKHIRSWGFLVIALVLGAIEFSLGLYDNK